MDKAVYKFIYVPVIFILGIYIVSILLEAFVPNPFFRYLLIVGGLLLGIATYYREQLKSFF